MPGPEAQALKSELALLEEKAREAGKIALTFFGGDYKSWSKSGGSPVTEADLAIDTYLKNSLRAARPDHGWLSEESVDDPARLQASRLFIVDPIDGTVAFLKNRPHFTICIALVESGRPLAGVVFNPATNECFTAHLDGGAHLNGAPIRVGAQAALAGCRMLGQKALFDDPANHWPPMHVENVSSIAYRLALVAAGRFDAMVSLTVKRDWDLAAADIILAEAGGILCGADGARPVYNLAPATQGASIAAAPALNAAILEHLPKLAKKGA